MKQYILVTESENKICKKAQLLLEKSSLSFTESRVNSPDQKEAIEEQIGVFTTYPQIYYMDEDFPVHIGGYKDLQQHLAVYGRMDESHQFDDTITINEVRDLSCLEN